MFRWIRKALGGLSYCSVHRDSVLYNVLVEIVVCWILRQREQFGARWCEELGFAGLAFFFDCQE